MSLPCPPAQIPWSSATLCRVQLLTPEDAASTELKCIKSLASLRETTEGLRAIREENPDLKWDEDIASHALQFESADANFRMAMKDHENASNGELNAASGFATRKGELLIGGPIGELREQIAQHQLILDVFINSQKLFSLYSQCQKAACTVEQLKDSTQQLCHLLTKIARKLPTSREYQEYRINHQQNDPQHIPMLIHEDLDDQATYSIQSKTSGTGIPERDRAQWQECISLAAEELTSCCKMRMRMLLQREIEAEPNIEELQRLYWQKAVNCLVHVFDGELTGGLCFVVAPLPQDPPPSDEIIAEEVDENEIVPSSTAALIAVRQKVLIRRRAFDMSNLSNVDGQPSIVRQPREYRPPIRHRRVGEPEISTVYENRNLTAAQRIELGMKSNSNANATPCPVRASPAVEPGMEDTQCIPQPTALSTELNRAVIQEQSNSALVRELPQVANELAMKSIYAEDKYSYTLGIWARGSGPLDCDEKDLNVEGEGEAEQFTKADGQTPVCSPDKSLAKEITKLPRILLQDVEDASISPTKTLMSGVGTVQMAS